MLAPRFPKTLNYYLLKNPPQKIKNDNPHIALISKNILILWGVVKQFVVNFPKPQTTPKFGPGGREASAAAGVWAASSIASSAGGALAAPAAGIARRLF